MIKNIIILSLLFLLASCQNTKIETLEKKIIELEKKNENLKSQIEFSRLKNLQLILFPNKYKFKIGENEKVTGKFFEISKLHKYDIYQTDSLHSKESRKLILKDATEANFEVDFKPKSKKDDKLYLLAVFKLDSLRLEFPGFNQFQVE